jgi:hypothetical protein
MKTNLIEELVGEAYEIGHAHGGNAYRSPPQRVDDGWGPIAGKINQQFVEARRSSALEVLNEIVSELGGRAKMPSRPEEDMKAIFEKLEELFARYETTGRG